MLIADNNGTARVTKAGCTKERLMKRTLIGLAAAGLTALAVAATPALAANAPWTDNGTCPMTGNSAPANSASGSTAAGQNYGPGAGYMMGNGRGPGQGPGNGMGYGMGNGMGQRGQGLAALPTGTLTDAQKTQLAAMAEEEKLAHDVYATLGTTYPDVWQFSHIVNAETMHLNAVRMLLTRYGVNDPTSGTSVGDFTGSRFQTLYNELVAGATTGAKALDAGVTVEKTDIVDLTSALSGLTAPDVTQVYTNLRAASQRHLAAFGG
jgi:hypothetical protein